MLFNSHVFILLFLPVALGGYLLLGRFQAGRHRVIWLLACSLYYYSWWSAAYLPLVLLSVAVNYFLGQFISAASPDSRRRIMIAGVTFNLALLAFYKYTGFGVDILNSFTSAGIPRPDIILPLAISFFTFQQIAYLVDTSRGDSHVNSLPTYALFVTFFPHMIAGPITHHREIIPQLDPRRNMIRSSDFAVGMTLFILGLAKKALIADTLADYANPVFNGAAQGNSLTAGAAWFGSLAYSFQLYFDFSGYSDMAIGLGRLFGVRFPVNFNSPYKANNMIDFWRRWHMTLSRFLRDYLYIALGGNRHGPARRYVNLAVTMLLGGLWHGASWTFVIWGAIHGGLLCLNHAWRAVAARLNWNSAGLSAWGRLANTAAFRTLTFGAVTIAWVFFRAADTGVALHILGAMFGFGAQPGADAWTPPAEGAFWLLGCLAIVWFAPNTQEFTARFQPTLGAPPPRPGGQESPAETEPPPAGPAWSPHPGWAAALGSLGLITILALSKATEFIYYQF